MLGPRMHGRQPTTNQVELLEDLPRRLLLVAAVGLVSAAEDAARARTLETKAIALLTAHAACEFALVQVALDMGGYASVRRRASGHRGAAMAEAA